MQYSVVKDIPYDQDRPRQARADAPVLTSSGRRNLDLYLPQSNESELVQGAPLFIFIHGGLWVSGDKSDGETIGRYFASKGFVVASVNYRLSEKGNRAFLHPFHTLDVVTALYWLSSVACESPEFGKPDRNRVVMCGHSVGAHMLGLLLVQPEQYRTDQLSIRAMIGLQGVYNTVQFCKDSPKWRGMVETAMPDGEDIWSSPVDTPVGKQTQPAEQKELPVFVICHSLEDPWVDANQAREWDRHLKAGGVRTTVLLPEKGGNHDDALRRFGNPDIDAAGTTRDALAVIEPIVFPEKK